MDDMRERVASRRVPVVLQVVHVHVSVAEATAGRKVEVSDNLVDAQAALDAAALFALLVELLGVVFPLALLHALAPTEGPGGLGICFTDFVAGIAAAGLLRVGRGSRRSRDRSRKGRGGTPSPHSSVFSKGRRR